MHQTMSYTPEVIEQPIDNAELEIATLFGEEEVAQVETEESANDNIIEVSVDEAEGLQEEMDALFHPQGDPLPEEEVSVAHIIQEEEPKPIIQKRSLGLNKIFSAVKKGVLTVFEDSDDIELK